MSRRIKEKLIHLLKKVGNQPGIKLFSYFFVEVMGGYRVYRRILRKYGRKTICICMHTGTGDMYNIGLYFKAFLEKEQIEDYIFVFRGKSEKKIGELFGIKGEEIISNREAIRLSRFAQFVGADRVNIKHIHHYPYVPQAYCHLDLLEGYNGLTFNVMFKKVAMGLPDDCAITEPKFEIAPDIEKKFQELQLESGRTVILAPYSSSAAIIGLEVWEKIVIELKKDGYTIATNCDNKNERPIIGTVPLFFEYRFAKAYVEYAGFFIGARSGLCDIISSANCKKVILTPRWDSSLLWRGGPGKTLNFYGMKYNYAYLQDTVEIEYDADSKDHIPEIAAPRIVNGICGNKIIKLIQNNAPKFQNRAAIALAFNEFFAPYASVTIQSILEFSKDENDYDIILLNDGLSAGTKEMMLAPFEGKHNFSVRFIDYRSILDVSNLHVERGYIPITYARIILPSLLKEYEKIIYMDSDMIANSDIAELYKIQMGDNLIAAVRDLPMIAWASDPENDEYENVVKKLKLSDWTGYINAGLLVINVELFNQKVPLDAMVEFATNNQLRWQDQDIFNKLCDGKIYYLPQEYNVITSLRDDEDIIRGSKIPELISVHLDAQAAPKIIHYIGCSFLFITNQTRWESKYWIIAKNSPYYELVLYRALQRLFPHPKTIVQKIVSLFRRR